MKKLLIALPIILLVFTGCIYIFIPSVIIISDSTTAKTTRDGTFRMIADKQQWQKWLNYGIAEKPSITNRFSYNNYNYNLIKAGNYSAIISIEHAGETTTAQIILLQYKTDSIGINCSASLQASPNPLTRIHQYFESIKLSKNITDVLNYLKSFVEKDENIYGFKIFQTTTKDNFLISTKKMFTQPPTMNDVYNLINVLKQYTVKNNYMQTNAPMLNISEDSNKYRVMVALPINKEIQTQQPISFVKMTNGNFIFTRVQGGLSKVESALNQMQLYFSDYNRTSMAITFQYLVTDRMQEKDSTKWITEIYAPVM